MATRKIKILAGSGLLLAVAGGTWLAMNLFAAQAQGTLSQHPMNLKVSAPPSFIMAVDDSGSMTFQTQFRGRTERRAGATRARASSSRPGS